MLDDQEGLWLDFIGDYVCILVHLTIINYHFLGDLDEDGVLLIDVWREVG